MDLTAPSSPASSSLAPAPAEVDKTAPATGGAPDLEWVWTEVRKRVFLKLPFSNIIADALTAAHPIVLEKDHFVVGLSPRDMPLAPQLTAQQVKNTIENILSGASHRPIQLEVIEGRALADWELIRERRDRAHDAVLAMAQQQSSTQHVDDVLNQIVSEIRSRVTCSKDRGLPQVRAQMLLDVVPSLSDAEAMLFEDPDSHDARRAMARALDRVASFLEIQPIYLALEVERYRREHSVANARSTPQN